MAVVVEVVAAVVAAVAVAGEPDCGTVKGRGATIYTQSCIKISDQTA